MCKPLINFKINKYKCIKSSNNPNLLENEIPAKYSYNFFEVKNYISSKKIEYNLSLIVPVYNAEKYIETCLNSLLNQNTKYSYQIIIINDGSIDSSEQILNKFEENPIIFVYNKKNGGISSARNYGLSKSSGEYIGFIDNDDWVSDTYVERLLDVAYQNHADVVKCGHECIYPDKKITYCNNEYKTFENNFKKNIMNYDGLIWGGIQHRNIWTQCCFPENYWFEDMISRCLIYRLASTFVYINEVLYFKREHTYNASKTLWKIDNPKCLDQVFLVKEIIKIDRKLNINDDQSLIKTILYEYGEMLYYRTTRKYRKIAFNLASNILVSNFKLDDLLNLELNTHEKSILLSLINNDYFLWKIIIKLFNN